MREINCAYVRLVDAVAAGLWAASIGLLLVDHFTTLGQPSWLTRWSVMIGMLAVAATMVATASWVVREIDLKETAAGLDELVRLRSRK